MEKDTRAKLDALAEIAGPTILMTALQGGAFLEIEEILPETVLNNRKWRVRLVVDPTPAA